MIRPSRVKTLTEEQKAQVRELRKQPSGQQPFTGHRLIAVTLGVSEAAVRRELGCENDSCGRLKVKKNPNKRPLDARIPHSILAERDRAYLADDTIETCLLGSPRPGRSALDKRNALG